MNGQLINVGDYKGKVVLIVNTSSKCGLTPLFKDLKTLYQDHQAQGLEVLGLTCNQITKQNSGSNKKIHKFCQLNDGVSFTMFEKIEINKKILIPSITS